MSRRGWLLFLTMGGIWGLPYLLIRIAIRDFSPGTLVFFRTGVAALLLIPIALHRDAFRPLFSKWKIVLIYTAVEVAVPWLLLFSAEEHLSSSVSGLLVSTVPFIGAGIALATKSAHRLTKTGVLGLAVGLGGVSVLVGVNVQGTTAVAFVEILGTAIGYAFGPMLVSNYLVDVPPLGVVTASLALTAVAYSPYAVTHLPAKIDGEVVAAIALLVVICTVIAFLVFFELIAEVGPVKSTVITYINTAVALVLGVAILNEPFTIGIAIGFPLILLGSVLTTRSTNTDRTVVVADLHPN